MTKKTRLTTAKQSTSSSSPPTQEKKKRKPSEKKASGASATKSSAPLPENFLSDALELAAKSTHRGIPEPPPPDPTPPQSPVSAIERDEEGNLSGLELTQPVNSLGRWPTMDDIDPKWFGPEGPHEEITTVIEEAKKLTSDRDYFSSSSSDSDSDEDQTEELHEEDQEEKEESHRQTVVRRHREEAQEEKKKKLTRKAYTGWNRISSSLLEQAVLTLSATSSSSTRPNWFSTRRPDFPRMPTELEDLRGMMMEVEESENEIHIFDADRKNPRDQSDSILADLFDALYSQWQFTLGMGSAEDKRRARASLINFGRLLFRSYHEQTQVAKNILLKTEHFSRTPRAETEAMRKGLKSWGSDLTYHPRSRVNRHRFGRDALERSRDEDLAGINIFDQFSPPRDQPYSFSSTRHTPNAREQERERRRAEEMERNRASEDYWQSNRPRDNTRGRSREQPRDRSRERRRDRSRERPLTRSRSRDRAPTRDNSWGWPDHNRYSDSGSGRGNRIREGRRERSRSREATTGDSAPHSPDTPSPPRRRSRANDYDSEGQRTSTLVTAIKLPTSNKIITPGVGTGWNETIEYLQSCLTQQTSRRINDWPANLITSITTQWSVNPLEEYRNLPGYHDESWKNLTTKELIVYMETLGKKGHSSVIPFDREGRREQLLTVIHSYPFKIDFERSHSATSHPGINAMNNISSAIRLFEVNGDRLTEADQIALCKAVWDLIDISGIRKLAKQNILEEIKQACWPKDAQGGIINKTAKDLRLMILTICRRFTDLLKEKAHSESIFTAYGSTHERQQQNPTRDRDPKSGKAKSDSSAQPQHEKKKKNKTSSSSSEATGNSAPRKKCDGCGYNLATRDGKDFCNRKAEGQTDIGCHNDPRRNKEKGVRWVDSTVGKAWAKLNSHSLPKDPATTLSNYVKDYDHKKTGTNLHTLTADNSVLQPELISFSVPQVDDKLRSAKRKRKDALPPSGKLLLDTGALGSNVMSLAYAKRLRKHKDSYTTYPASHAITTAANKNNKLKCNKFINLNVSIDDESSTTTAKAINITAAVAPIDVDLIIDRDTIKDNNLVQHFPSHFAKGELLERIRMLPIDPTTENGPRATTLDNETVSEPVPWIGTVRSERSLVDLSNEKYRESTRKSFFVGLLHAAALREQAFTEAHQGTPTFLANLTAIPADDKKERLTEKIKAAKRKREKTGKIRPLFPKRQLADLEKIYIATMRPYDDNPTNFSDKSPYEREGKLGLDEIPEHKLESIPTDILREIEEDNEYTKVHVNGSPQLQEKLRKLVAEFKDIFKSSVQKEPSNAFKPFELTVDEAQWEQPCHAGPARTSSRERQTELDRMLKIMLEKGLVEDCTHSYYSHAFLTPKPNGTWRFVLDFKGLNKATTSKYNWPIPNIKDMLTRVGDSRPEFFAVFDLTSGYYQAPISEESRKYTAFKTQKGLYRWKRLPMGLTDAGSYFQHQLTTNVLHGLIHNICELYLDDCMVYAGDIDEYLERLRTVFLRFRECKITLNPSKCYLGLTQVEYVGHTINKNGLHFTRDKLDSVLNFPRPETMKNVKSFIGLANYFRDHIRNHSLRVQPLQDLVEGYTKSVARSKIEWTEECDKAFRDIRQAIDECPLLWFVDDYSPIFLKTDASDYGIGAYLYQVVNQEDGSTKEHPIGFISKSLVSGHGSWDIPMKEGFAIFYALRKWEYLLRDRKFTVLTDHENLTRLRTERNTNKMVTRWFMAYQDYDIIEWVHVPGTDNEVPDSFSRLCANVLVDEEAHEHTSLTHLFQLTGYEMDPAHWDIIKKEGHGNDSDRGHGGVKRTIAVLSNQGHNWPSMAKDVRKFIKMCPCCQKMNTMKPVIHSYPYTLSTYGLFHTVSVDLIEQLAVDDYGMSMIVVIIDNFSRFVDLYPISNTSAEAAADALLQFTGRFTTPLQFTTDSGANFKSDLIQGLTNRLGADHHLTKAYSKQQNSIVERVNREVLAHLKALIFDKRVQRKWSKYLPIVQRYINSSIHSATGCTPAEIVFPSGAQIDKELLVHENGVVVSAYIKDMQEAQGRIIALAEQHLRNRDQKHMDAHVGEEPEFQEGDFVLVEHRHNSLRRGPKSKMLPFRAGPLRVLKKLPNGMYTLRDLLTMEPKDFHVSRMFPFLYDERTLQPMQVAATDTFDEFIIEKVLDMRGNPRGPKTQIEFKVRWAGYGEADDTWEVWKNCRTSNAVQLYLYNHPNRRIRSLGMKDFDPNRLDDGLDFERNSDNED